jgi:murein L,D-transpeptidase YcbB/YkuD
MATIGMIAPQPAVTAQETAPVQPLPDMRIRINIPATTLQVFKDGALAASYPVSIGALAYKSPVMQNQLTQLVWNPSWIPPPDSPWAAGLKPEPPGPRNPLGPVKLPLEQGIRIHGTNKDSSVGRPASHGCFRMHNKDAAELAWFIQQNVSDKTDNSFRETYARNRYRTHIVQLMAPVQVDIIYEPVELADNILVIHPDLYGWGGKMKDRIVAAIAAQGIQESDIHPTFWQRVKIGARKGSQHIPLNELTSPPIENRHLDKD